MTLHHLQLGNNIMTRDISVITKTIPRILKNKSLINIFYSLYKRNFLKITTRAIIHRTILALTFLHRKFFNGL